MSILLVAGLGNPGPRYARTRHNIGWGVLDALAARLKLEWISSGPAPGRCARWVREDRSVWLYKPGSYVNVSGEPIRAFAAYHKIPSESAVLVYDDVALDFLRVKVTLCGSAGGHNGVEDVIGRLGPDFVRYRIGIGPRHPPEIDLKDFVLAGFTSDEQRAFDSRLDALVDGLVHLVEHGPVAAMNLLNRTNNNS